MHILTKNSSGERGVFVFVVIIANGNMDLPLTIDDVINKADLIIAADGGARNCLAIDVIPGALIGDFDSLTKEELESLESKNVEIIRHPAQKDYTDLELALRLARERGAEEICILGALGARYDQTLANLLLPIEAGFSIPKIRMIHGTQEVHYIHAEQTLTIDGEIGDIISLIPLMGDAHGITTTGLEYPLRKETLLSGSTRGISNVMIASPATIQVHNGTILCVHIKSDGGAK
jgi:thiamine pyrophosphokinase